MPSKEQESSSILSVRLAEALLQRLDRSLDWWETTRRVKSSRNAVRLLLDSRVVIGQFLCNSLFLQAFYEGRDRCCIFRKNRLISSPYVLSMMCRTLESNKSLRHLDIGGAAAGHRYWGVPGVPCAAGLATCARCSYAAALWCAGEKRAGGPSLRRGS